MPAPPELPVKVQDNEYWSISGDSTDVWYRYSFFRAQGCPVLSVDLIAAGLPIHSFFAGCQSKLNGGMYSNLGASLYNQTLMVSWRQVYHSSICNRFSSFCMYTMLKTINPPNS
jgi:hypothetical protein